MFILYGHILFVDFLSKPLRKLRLRIHAYVVRELPI